MSGQTPRGYIYATPDDPLVNWPATSQTLAQAVDALEGTLETDYTPQTVTERRDPVNGLNIQEGFVNLSSTGGNVTSQDVTFSTPFTATPIIMLTAEDGMTSISEQMAFWVNNKSATGCRINLVRTNSNTTTIRWIALGPVA